MTAPRPVIARRTYLMSRRCTQRQFLLRPDERVDQIYRYCLAEAVMRYRMSLHAFLAMSNHQHLIVRDNEGNFPEFLAHLNKMLAKALNAYRGRWENFWATEQPSAVHLLDADSRFEKLVYVLANPVSDHLVERVADWPGASSLEQHLSSKAKVIKRPVQFFRQGGRMPAEVTLRLERLEGFEHLSELEWRQKIERSVRAAEAWAREVRMKKGTRVLGRKAVLRAQPTDTPKTKEPRRRLRPSVACRGRRRRATELAALAGVRSAHRAAIRRWLAGDHAVEFPFGTYRARIGAPCAVAGVPNPAASVERGRVV